MVPPRRWARSSRRAAASDMKQVLPCSGNALCVRASRSPNCPSPTSRPCVPCHRLAPTARPPPLATRRGSARCLSAWRSRAAPREVPPRSSLARPRPRRAQRGSARRLSVWRSHAAPRGGGQRLRPVPKGWRGRLRRSHRPGSWIPRRPRSCPSVCRRQNGRPWHRQLGFRTTRRTRRGRSQTKRRNNDIAVSWRSHGRSSRAGRLRAFPSNVRHQRPIQRPSPPSGSSVRGSRSRGPTWQTQLHRPPLVAA